MANQRITTDEVRLRIDELNKIIQKNKEVGQAVATGITAMNSGITSAMRYNVMDKTLVALRGVNSLFESLQTGRNLLQQVVDAYESADASLKNGVQDWVGDTNVTSVITAYHGKIDELADGTKHERNGIECKGYANYVFYELFGKNLGTIKNGRVWELNTNDSITQIGSISQTDQNLSLDSLKTLFQDAMPGDAIQLYWKNGFATQHTMIMQEIELENGIIKSFKALEGNHGGAYGNIYTYDIENFFGMINISGGGVSIYRANNYWKSPPFET